MYKNILIPVLFDEGHDETQSFETAKALAADGAKFTVIHAMEPIPTYAQVNVPKQILKDSRAKAEALLEEKAAKLPGAKGVMTEGYAGRDIVEYANENGIDCIVMASHKEGLSSILLGSVSAKVVRHANCSVHVIR